jgi:hypothetical protein
MAKHSEMQSKTGFGMGKAGDIVIAWSDDVLSLSQKPLFSGLTGRRRRVYQDTGIEFNPSADPEIYEK